MYQENAFNIQYKNTILNDSKYLNNNNNRILSLALLLIC